jgi:hypothetical protein
MHAILVTTDGDFWDDRNFPLAWSPGVIIISGQSASEKTYTFAMIWFPGTSSTDGARFLISLEVSSSKPHAGV